jgi:SAM-dependent methyltransferase
VAALSPRAVLEIGCGRGDVLRLLHEAYGVQVAGIDFGKDLADAVWPSIRDGFRAGDILDVLSAWDGTAYDIACGFDIWEHLLPRTLDDTIEQLVARSTDDALFVFVVPAFGDDVVFREQFPLELEENRDAFDRREPFRFLIADATDDHVPAAGHLTWAHTDWWVERFQTHGLVREHALERRMHPVIDAHVPHSIKSFYIFRRPTRAAAERVDAILKRLRRTPAAVRAFRAIARRRQFESRGAAEFNVTVGTEAQRWADAHTGIAAPLVKRGLTIAADRSHRHE